MEYLIGSLATAVYFLSLLGAYALGRRAKTAGRGAITREVDEQERQRAERLKKSFEQLMSYDVSTALRGRR
jgi:hypothetical protein